MLNNPEKSITAPITGSLNSGLFNTWLVACTSTSTPMMPMASEMTRVRMLEVINIFSTTTPITDTNRPIINARGAEYTFPINITEAVTPMKITSVSRPAMGTTLGATWSAI